MRACVWVGCNWWMMANNSFVCIILLLNECMQDVVKYNATVPSSRVYVIMRVPKRVDFVCPRCDTSPCFTLFLFFFPCSLPPFFCSKTIYIKQKQKCLSTLANVRINIFSSPFSNPLYLGGLANVPPPTLSPYSTRRAACLAQRPPRPYSHHQTRTMRHWQRVLPNHRFHLWRFADEPSQV